jgi:hypothetical protein
MSLRIHVYALCWNEERFLPYFLRHYGSFAEKIHIFDNMSSDRSVDIIKSFPNTHVERFDTNELLRDDILRDLKGTRWKDSKGRADWVICVDTDEILWHARLVEYLQSCQQRSITIPVPSGYEMVSDSFPTTPGQVYDEVKQGAFNVEYCKPCIFNPNAIMEMNYNAGCHLARPVGRVIVDPRSDLKLLHYRFLGLDYVLPRFQVKFSRCSEINKQNNWGAHYGAEKEQIIQGIELFKRESIQVVP